MGNPLDSQSNSTIEYTPLVIVEGFLGGVGDLVRGNFQTYLDLDCRVTRRPRRRIIFPHIGPVSSLHDRACELFAALKGGIVDYGEEHSKNHRHSRFGRTIESGLYPQWDSEHPLHFMGHSIGGSTIIKLQYLLSKRFFGPNFSEDMIYSVCTICAPFRGTQLVHTLGMSTSNAPAVEYWSLGETFVSKFIHVLAYFSPLLPSLLDVHAESRALTYKDPESFFALLRNLRQSEWSTSRDCAPFDATFQSADEREAEGEGLLFPNTYYRSFSATLTTRLSPSESTHAPSFSTALFSPLLYITSKIMGTYDLSQIRPIPSFLRHFGATPPPLDVLKTKLGEEYWANDGVVPIFSQWHPMPCDSFHCSHHGSPSKCEENAAGGSTNTAGIWHVFEADEAHHLTVAPFWISNSKQKLFWETLGDWLRAIED
ncbi:alpha/beta-hydrolase [Flagelloscypha sp. PMI_526]|nr:alpha/beta-hydrolase [Flagelloscypha sp. PMI_526]